MSHLVTYSGTILFEPENKTKKHLAQASWKKVAMVMFEGDIAEYYSWFLKKRFNLELNKPLRGAHITFINDAVEDLNNRVGTIEEKEAAWEKLKSKWSGKQIDITLNLRPFSDIYHWWLIVDHKHREGLHAIRAEVGLGRPYFGLHMTFGNLVDNFEKDRHDKFVLDNKGNKKILFDKNVEHSKYINSLNNKNLILINQDYTVDSEIHLKRIPTERSDLYNSKHELIGTLYNEYELNHVRIQIAQQNLEGYYLKWKGQIIPIESNGKINDWPKGFHDLQEIQLAELFKAQTKTKNSPYEENF